MIKKVLFAAPAISAEFKYPAAFLDYCATAENDSLEPWYIFEDAEEAADWLGTVREWYPTRNLIPFARDDVSGDDIACFDGADIAGDPKVHFVHTFASAGWEDRGNVMNFAAWLVEARKDHAAYLAQLAEDEAHPAARSEDRTKEGGC